MKLTEAFSAATIAENYTSAASNSVPYLGEGFFPPEKKAGLDLKWIKGHKGLPVMLAPSNFDTKSKFRGRVGVEVSETEMAFFRESIKVSEKDEQEILRVQESNDPYAVDVLNHIYDDTSTLIEGADVVPERMRMQLLAPLNGKVGVDIVANGANYTYNYDSDGSWKGAHYVAVTDDADKWTASETCDPIRDLEALLDMQEDSDAGNRPEILLMSKRTFNLMRDSKKVRSGVLAQNMTANINYTSKIVKAYVEEALDVKIIIYTKTIKDENEETVKLYPDNIIAALPGGSLGKTWFGTTPEERTLKEKPDADVAIVKTGITVTVTVKDDPVATKVTASEICLPSFERMDEFCAIEVA